MKVAFLIAYIRCRPSLLSKRKKSQLVPYMLTFGAPYEFCTLYILNSVYAEQSAYVCVHVCVGAIVIFHQVREVLCSWNSLFTPACPRLHVFHSVIGRIFHHGMQFVETDALPGQLGVGRRHGGVASLVDGCCSCERCDVNAGVLRCADRRCAGQRSSGRVSKHQQTPRQHLEVTD